ncbi:ATP synthase F1 subunit delta [Gloeocapsa sp. PCC 73106]|uniref:ATP synthase F1 subunit delta n=1 Tax=Gloeocapsa sp. PCC 73106 TaxID=102232 RepID=UPI0002AC0BA9|nr:ATP synthase F1 subunit delta [Gloeocapsa sp. PCC 73106]ELR98746.1 ATP synthase, F1 delta subunit [Gloeocapsa sp. PCC 73106]
MTNSRLGAQIVEPYAEALMSVARANNLTEVLGENLRSLSTLWEESPELNSFLSNPTVKSEDKKAVLEQILGNEANSYLRNFMMLLVDRRRIMFLDGIAQRYLELLRKLNNVILAEVTSATAMDEAQLAAIRDKIKSLTKATGLELKTNVDPSLIGGVIIKVGSQVYDTSLQGQLRRIAINLGKA